MIKENIIENIFYRFNPFYPERLPDHESNPVDPQDRNIKLGKGFNIFLIIPCGFY